MHTSSFCQLFKRPFLSLTKPADALAELFAQFI